MAGPRPFAIGADGNPGPKSDRYVVGVNCCWRRDIVAMSYSIEQFCRGTLTMRRISRSQAQAIDRAMHACEQAADELDAAVVFFNDALARVRDRLEGALASYNERVSEFRSIYDGIHEEAQSYFDERSQRWQQSDAGRVYQAWLDQLADPDIGEAELEIPELPDFPDFTDVSWLPAEAPDH